MTAPVVALTARLLDPITAAVHRRSAVVDARDDLTAHCVEALEFVDLAWPHVSALERVAIEIGPDALHHALDLGRLLASYERRHLPPDPEPAEAVA